MSDVSGRNILITGGASGIGRLVALKMAQLGGNIVIWDIDPVRPISCNASSLSPLEHS